PGAGVAPAVSGMVSLGATNVSCATAVSCVAVEPRAVVSRAVVSRAVTVSRAVVVSRLVVESCAMSGAEPSSMAASNAAEKRRLVIPVLPALRDTRFHHGFVAPVSRFVGAGGGPSGTSEGGRLLARTESCFAFSLLAWSVAAWSAASFTFQLYLARSSSSIGGGTATYCACCDISLSRY